MRAQRLRPARVENADIAHRIVESFGPAFTTPSTTWFFSTRLYMMRSVSNIDRIFAARHAGENEDAVRTQVLQHFKRELRRARGFVDQVDVAHLLGHLLDRCVCSEEMYRAPDAFRDMPPSRSACGARE